jgi:beta-lactamase class A
MAHRRGKGIYCAVLSADRSGVALVQRRDPWEGRPIQAAPPRRRPLEQARRFVSQKNLLKRCLGPVVVAGIAAGLVMHVLLGDEPAPPRPDPVATVEPTIEIVLEAVPVAESTAPIEPVAAAEPAPDPRVIAQQQLREGVFAPFRGLQGRFGIAVKDLGTGYAVLLNESFPFEAASLYKLPVMYEVFRQREEGLLTFREEMTIGADDAAMDLGTLFWPVGTRITVGTGLERMVTVSDNSTAVMLAKKVGTWKINEDVEGLGLTRTWIQDSQLATSALDMLRLLELIARGEAVDAQSSAEMVHLMSRQQVRNRIPVLLPPEAVVANKTGNWESAAHDVAIVYGPRSTFILAFLADGITDFDAVYEAMSRSARNVYDLTTDPAFGTQAVPPLPPLLYSTYAEAPKLPAGMSSASNQSQSQSGTGSSGASRLAGPTAPPQPAQVAPAQAAPARAQAVATPTPQPPREPPPAPAAPAPPAPPPGARPKPTAAEAPANPAPKPTARPSSGENGNATPVVKPAAPPLFSPPSNGGPASKPQ